MTRKTRTKSRWTVEIEPRQSWFNFYLTEFWSYRELIFLLVKRDFHTHFKQTVLGPFWHVIQPLLTTLVFTIVFGRFANIPTDGIPPFLFYLSGIVLWGYLSGLVNKVSVTFTANIFLFRKVYFPRLIVPIATVFSGLISFSIQFVMFIGFVVYFSVLRGEVSLSPWLILLPVLLVNIAMLGAGVGLIISAMTTKYRDLAVLVGFATQLWMFATPIVYPLSLVPEQYKFWVELNPMTSTIEFFRYLTLGSGTAELNSMIYSFAVSLVVFLIGVILFNQAQSTFVDTV